MKPDSSPATRWKESYLPSKPLCSDAKDGSYKRRERSKALAYPYIEVNPYSMCAFLVFDIDDAPIDFLTSELHLPCESWSVKNENFHSGHLGYALSEPVCLTDAARRRPINLLARVEAGLSGVLGSDPGYGHRITKNPLTPPPGTFTEWGAGELDFPSYTLKQLAGALKNINALPAWNDPLPRKSSGIGRNVDIFDRTRKWSYRAIKHFWKQDLTAWSEAVEAKATILNINLEKEAREPLPSMEIKHLSRSIARWTWRNFDQKAFSALQRARVNKRWQTREKLIREANEFASIG